MKKKLNRAIRILKDQDAGCVICWNDQEALVENEIGIKTLMNCLRKDKNAFAGGAVADRVIGKAAALLIVLGGGEAAYGELMSEKAVEVFRKHGILYEYGTLVPFIENRTQTGCCPMEETVWDIGNPEEAFDALERTISRLMQAKKTAL
ncbi:DUF1893 domain-containing protein [Parasporobacterium paucivorans]|uniref:DUF1893 domain-containing protein n=1 Tax=Parasporobacterium paucivorans DSM 15970 TaxID=1122934 RepID=A0A1M6DIF4_9FIRM|nr:DUF1893 domain-containing protein [Parasporobacterium paucivorans]SHI73137.1 protein of unknown function [Parasporobacterium paucivorans DSM 15970]